MMLQVHGYFGIAVLIQQKKTGITVDAPFLRRLLSVCNDAFQRSVHIACIVVHTGILRLVDFIFLGSQFFQRGCVNGTTFSCHILITILVSQIFTLALSRPKDSPFLSFLFGDIVKLLSMVERPEFDKHILSHPDLKFHHLVIFSVI